MKTGIIGLGLIGGSLFIRLAKEGFDTYAVTGNPETIKQAKKYSPNVSNDINTLKDCDIVFVASPINATEKVLDDLENVVSKECIVSDCASVKEFIVKKDRPYKFIGSHPMAGSEFSGFTAADEKLFEGAKWVLTPKEDIEHSYIEKLTAVIIKTGAQTIIAEAKEHDEAVALISHMPLLLAQALFYCASDNKLAMKLASSGFRDMTRLAMSNLTMAEDMRKYNASNIDSALGKLNISLDFLKNAKVPEIFADIKHVRSEMYSKEGKNIL